MLLSRPLLSSWLQQSRGGQTIDLDRSANSAEMLTDRIRELLERGNRTIYLRAASGQLSALCAAVSYLSDAGVDTQLGMIYPMITDITTVFPEEPAAAPMVELTIRPIL
jgi:hypothetical protein